jgi:hypothetical protein
MVEEQLLRSVEVVSDESDFDAGPGLAAGGANNEEPRLRQARAERLLRGYVRNKPGTEKADEERSDRRATGGRRVPQVHDGTLKEHGGGWSGQFGCSTSRSLRGRHAACKIPEEKYGFCRVADCTRQDGVVACQAV